MNSINESDSDFKDKRNAVHIPQFLGPFLVRRSPHGKFVLTFPPDKVVTLTAQQLVSRASCFAKFAEAGVFVRFLPDWLTIKPEWRSWYDRVVVPVVEASNKAEDEGGGE